MPMTLAEEIKALRAENTRLQEELHRVRGAFDKQMIDGATLAAGLRDDLAQAEGAKMRAEEELAGLKMSLAHIGTVLGATPQTPSVEGPTGPQQDALPVE